MIKIKQLIKKASQEGYKFDEAKAKISQDIILKLLENSKYKNNITIKGGVVMRSLSKNVRRATMDLDFDLIHYPISESAVINLIKGLNKNDEGLYIEINGELEKLKHQNYKGVRAIIGIKDYSGYEIQCKVDIGVHKYLSLKQNEYCFEVDFNNKGITLLVNSKEQMFVEKLKSLLYFGEISTRFKDVYDLYYLIPYINKIILKNYIKTLILDDNKMKETGYKEIFCDTKDIFTNKIFLYGLNKSNKNWLNLDNKIVLSSISKYLASLI